MFGFFHRQRIRQHSSATAAWKTLGQNREMEIARDSVLSANSRFFFFGFHLDANWIGARGACL